MRRDLLRLQVPNITPNAHLRFTKVAPNPPPSVIHNDPPSRCLVEKAEKPAFIRRSLQVFKNRTNTKGFSMFFLTLRLALGSFPFLASIHFLWRLIQSFY